jgi:hypothetical protein
VYCCISKSRDDVKAESWRAPGVIVTSSIHAPPLPSSPPPSGATLTSIMRHSVALHWLSLFALTSHARERARGYKGGQGKRSREVYKSGCLVCYTADHRLISLFAGKLDIDDRTGKHCSLARERGEREEGKEGHKFVARPLVLPLILLV